MQISKGSYIEYCKEKVQMYKAQGLGPKATYEKLCNDLKMDKLPKIEFPAMRNYYYREIPKISVL